MKKIILFFCCSSIIITSFSQGRLTSEENLLQDLKRYSVPDINSEFYELWLKLIDDPKINTLLADIKSGDEFKKAKYEQAKKEYYSQFVNKIENVDSKKIYASITQTSSFDEYDFTNNRFTINNFITTYGAFNSTQGVPVEQAFFKTGVVNKSLAIIGSVININEFEPYINMSSIEAEALIESLKISSSSPNRSIALTYYYSITNLVNGINTKNGRDDGTSIGKTDGTFCVYLHRVEVSFANSRKLTLTPKIKYQNYTNGTKHFNGVDTFYYSRNGQLVPQSCPFVTYYRVVKIQDGQFDKFVKTYAYQNIMHIFRGEKPLNNSLIAEEEFERFVPTNFILKHRKAMGYPIYGVSFLSTSWEYVYDNVANSENSSSLNNGSSNNKSSNSNNQNNEGESKTKNNPVPDNPILNSELTNAQSPEFSAKNLKFKFSSTLEKSDALFLLSYKNGENEKLSNKSKEYVITWFKDMVDTKINGAAIDVINLSNDSLVKIELAFTVRLTGTTTLDAYVNTQILVTKNGRKIEETSFERSSNVLLTSNDPKTVLNNSMTNSWKKIEKFLSKYIQFE